jgi:hypothetical protein
MDETPKGTTLREIARLRRLAGGVMDQKMRDAIAKLIEGLEKKLRDQAKPTTPKTQASTALGPIVSPASVSLSLRPIGYSEAWERRRPAKHEDVGLGTRYLSHGRGGSVGTFLRDLRPLCNQQLRSTSF